jgi:hypothetical protein
LTKITCYRYGLKQGWWKKYQDSSGYYHVMVRGNSRNDIFPDDDGKLKFIEILSQKETENVFLLFSGSAE